MGASVTKLHVIVNLCKGAVHKYNTDLALSEFELHFLGEVCGSTVCETINLSSVGSEKIW